MNKIVFFTSRFPFQVVGENFFESELDGVAAHYDEVYVVNCNCRKKNPEILKKIPSNVKVLSVGRKSFYSDIILGLITLPFTPFFYREVKTLLGEKKPFLAGLKKIVYSGSFYKAICRRLPKVAKSIEVNKDDKVLFCGYWLSYISAALIKLKKYFPDNDIKVVSRAHGPADIQNLMTPNRFYPFQKYLLENLDGILGISDTGCDYLKKFSTRPEIISRVYIGSYGADKYIEHSRTPFTVMSCANFFKHKRVEIIAESIRVLINDIPDIRWVHFGDGPLRSKIEEEYSDIRDHFEFKGNRSHQEVLDYFKSGETSVFVSASAAEGLPVSIMEAIGCSTPVVATDVNATCEAVITGKTGTLVDAHISGEDIAKAVLEYYKMDDDTYNDISKSAFEYWQQKLDCHKNAKILAEKLMSY